MTSFLFSIMVAVREVTSMENVIQVFNRVEEKYMLDEQEAEYFLEKAKDYLTEDVYPNYTLQNIYLDSTDNIMAIRSLEKPRYKEKLRLRTYGKPENNDPIFLEIKKKVDGVVNKRRVILNCNEMCDWLEGKPLDRSHGQIGNEFNYLYQRYKPIPKAYIAYDRKAWVGVDNPDLRLTMDRNIRYRTKRVELKEEDEDIVLLEKGKVLLEIKIQDSYPLWLAHLLCDMKVKETSFSKYGLVYKTKIGPIINTRNVLEKENVICLHQYLQQLASL